MEPEVKHKYLVEPGWVSLCARNYKLSKQKCYYKAKYDFAIKIYGKPFRLSSLEIKEGTFPREITNLNTCTPD